MLHRATRKSVEISVLEHFRKVFTKLKNIEKTSEETLKKNNFSVCSGEMTANARGVLYFFPGPLVFENGIKCSVI